MSPRTAARAPASRVEQAGRWRGWIERAGHASPRLPVWVSRDTWLHRLRRWTQSPALAEVCADQHVSITAATVVSIAAVMAKHADHATGRHVALTRATIAARVGCDVRTVTAAWRVLRAAGWALEARRGHGSPTTPSIGRRPSVYHLVEPRTRTRPATGWPGRLVDDFHLPPLGGVCSSPPVGRNSPSALERAQKSPPSITRNRRWRAEPRPLDVQRLAAGLAARCHGLHRGHVGALCDAITAAGIDPQHWTARQITDALDADMRRTGQTWPDRIKRPGAFLAARLRRHAETFNAPPATATTSPPDQNRHPHRPLPPPVLTAGQRTRIADARDHIRTVLSDAARHRSHAVAQ